MKYKFRAWDGKKMQYASDFNNCNETPFKDSEGAFPDTIIEITNFNYNWVWQQFTGLLDKNNKDIYEGDILSLPLAIHHNNKRRLVTVMEFQDFWNWKGDESPKDFYSEMEIIGNIFENPKLMK